MQTFHLKRLWQIQLWPNGPCRQNLEPLEPLRKLGQKEASIWSAKQEPHFYLRGRDGGYRVRKRKRHRRALDCVCQEICSSPNPDPVNIIVFGNGVFAAVIKLQWESPGLRWALLHGLLFLEGENWTQREGQEKTDGEMRVMLLEDKECSKLLTTTRS